MSHHRRFTHAAAIMLVAGATLGVHAADVVFNASDLTPSRARAMSQFKLQNRHAHFATHPDGRIGRVYGRAFSRGATTAQSVNAFVSQHVDIWGVSPDELVPEGPFEDGRHTVPVMYQPETDSYKFTATYFKQTRA